MKNRSHVLEPRREKSLYLPAHPNTFPSPVEVYQALGSAETTPHWTVQSTGSELFISLIISKAEQKFQSTLASYTIEDILLHKENPTSTTS
ncbi:hypothetical protein [Brevibacillus reuszeri]|uniref:hypothetical protein n=1 Tax=Brevibacillus reuszeri TaxID=54915 RepID=UPI003D1B5EEE